MNGYINCVRSAWDLGSEAFLISLLKHEAQHVQDLCLDPNMPSEDLEYRAKLVELIYSQKRDLLPRFLEKADCKETVNGHGAAACKIVRGISELLKIDETDIGSLSRKLVQEAAGELFAQSCELLLQKRS